MKSTRTVLIHGGLFIITLITTTLGGEEWTFGKSIFGPDYRWSDFGNGLPYSITFLGILTVHEFGHYFTAMAHRIKATLPYYIPLPWFLFPLGTMGAIIRIKDRVKSKQEHFDIGIAGPLAGFVVAIGVLWYAFTHLPPPEYIFQIHPDYAKYGLDYARFVYQPELMQKGVIDISIGENLIFHFFETMVADPTRVPNAHEMMHYPLLFAGFLSLVFTSINLLPIGQLDGGHVLYGLVGYRYHRIIGTVFFITFLFLASLGLISPAESSDDLLWEIPAMVLFLYLSLRGLRWDWKNTLLTAVAIFTIQYVLKMQFPVIHGYPTWLIFAFIIGVYVGIPHPPSEIEEPLSLGRKILGCLALLIFILCFTPDPL
jgi:membrane-associated protease RseP (regulator of RpoE activity)